MKWWMGVVLVVVALGCRETGPPTSHELETTRVRPSDLYWADSAAFEYIMRNRQRIWSPTVQCLLYELTASCLGEPSRLEEVEWYHAAAIVSLGEKRFVAGLYLRLEDGRHQIVLDDEFVASPSVVTHESIHHLLQVPDPIPDSIRVRCEFGYKPGG